MGTICFCGEIRKIMFGYLFLSGALAIVPLAWQNCYPDNEVAIGNSVFTIATVSIVL